VQNFIYSVPGITWLSENSYAYSLLFNGVWMFFKDLAASRAEARSAGNGHAPVSTFEYAVPMKAALSEYDVALAAALIERMQRFCSERSIRFMVADIPDVRGMRPIPSMPPALVKRLRALGIELVDGPALLAPYDGAAETHLPHGHRHISEFTHTLLGVDIARRVEGDRVAGQQHAVAQ
jgi:hypothetical protein